MADASRRNSILGSLNPAQRRAVSSNASTVAILAGPGSGKTHTLTSRVVWLVDIVRYRPQDVIVATFTVKAAREMGERIDKALGTERGKKIVLGTFHSISRRYLATYGKKIGLDQKFSIADDSDSRAVISRICKRLNLGIDPAMARGWISKKKSRARDEVPPPQKPGAAKSQNNQQLETCYQEYQDHLARSNLLDYDDLLVKCVELLRAAPECVSNVRAVLIDEYQDTNGIQYELMKLLAQGRQTITVVGDPDQSIYGWRSADIRNLSRMFADFPATDKVALEENYRSSERILATSLKIIQQDEKRFDKALKAVHVRGTKPVLRKLRSSSQEAEWIVSELKRILLLSGTLMTHDDVAILLRSASLSRHIESALGKAGIPYKMAGVFKFYERAEIKIVLDYLRVINQPDANDALARIINVPKRGAGDSTIKALLEEAEKSSQSLWSLLHKHCTGHRLAKTNIRKQVEQNLTSGLIRLVLDMRKRVKAATPEQPFGMLDIIGQVLSRLNFEQYLKDTYNDEWEGRWANVQELVNMATDFTKEAEADESLPEIDGVEQAPEKDTLAKFLANVSLATDVQKDDPDKSKPMVTVSTIHAAKGLEWPVVFIPAVYNGSIPHSRSEDGDEERRLLYVAMTRAKALLYLSRPLFGGYGSGERVELSSFISGVENYFAKHGPAFDGSVVEEIGRILGRKPPTQDQIFESLKPFEVSMDDDMFPVDPEQHDRDSGLSRTGSWVDGSGDRGPRVKRARHSAGAGLEQQEQQQWGQNIGFTTTMDQSAGFTMASFPGFVTAGSHHAAAPPAPAPQNNKKLAHEGCSGRGWRAAAAPERTGGVLLPHDHMFAAERSAYQHQEQLQEADGGATGQHGIAGQAAEAV
ncbi:ATP-dependent DNA helicase srs2 [Magnaporthiopsis poae ATCC 64411]|uniref:DNA 3'-5' helicase n=1 Tax=Magnaporthiopsis poae (strain ATCC 64411 / 73-15) TaxID=644358 RepID=A0A0C4E4X3_MAGP6|nr:ATP-dependent DNA helicase srs2 [Magnaporthiopsis poae ATCC 64411]